MWRCEDVKMWRWEDVKVWRCEDVKLRRCEDVKMRRCEDVKMWRCEDVKMKRCEDVKQTPTIRRTLRSGALGKNQNYGGSDLGGWVAPPHSVDTDEKTQALDYKMQCQPAAKSLQHAALGQKWSSTKCMLKIRYLKRKYHFSGLRMTCIL